MAFIDIHRAIVSSPAFFTSTDRVSIDRGGLTTSPLMAWVTCACILQMASQACFSNRTFTVVCAHFVVTSSSVITWFVLTVINVDATVRASPSIDTDTGVVTRRMVQTSGSIFTNIWIHQTFIDILFTELTSQSWGASACVRVVPVHTGRPIGTSTIHTIINIGLTVHPLET